MRPGSNRLAAKAAAAAAKAPADPAPAAAPAPVRAPPAGGAPAEEELAGAGSPPPAPSPLAEGLDSNPKPAYGQKELGRQVRAPPATSCAPPLAPQHTPRPPSPGRPPQRGCRRSSLLTTQKRSSRPRVE